MASNYDDVIRQITGAGLLVDHLVVGKMQRCKVEGDREKRGWYSVHEIRLDDGDDVLVGAYGVWRGDDNGSQKIQLGKRKLNKEQSAALRARLAEDRRRAEAMRAAEAKRAAELAESKWRTCVEQGESDYLARKAILAHGTRYFPEGAVLEWEYDGRPYVTPVGGALCVPMMDAAGRVHGLQAILSRSLHRDRIEKIGRDKEYWPAGMDKRGKFHLIGAPTWIILVAEGYATAASLHEATGFPVAVAFDAGNLQPVAAALHKRYPRARILICADDDAYGHCAECKAPVQIAAGADCPACGKPHKRENAGVTRASTAAMAVGGQYVAPKFADDAARWTKFQSQGHKITDFNDLHLAESLRAVSVQIEEAIARAGWQAPTPAAAAPRTGGEGSGETPLRPIDTLDELLERYALIYGEKEAVFDRAENMIVSLSDMRNICISRELHRRWMEHPAKQIVRMANVGFDPTQKDAKITCNTFAGWPTTPKAGECELLLELLGYLCSVEDNSHEVYQWLLKWLAYPIQNPGAKMQSAVVMHGPQGTGKTLFFKAIGKIYGRYGLTINQAAVENHRNTWLASRLYILAEEVVARQELYQVKNALKDLVTGDTVYVDPKFVNPYEERNHVNIVFLSNEVMPIVLEDDDRRHLVVWTPPLQPDSYYKAVRREMDEGGIAALHAYLLDLDLTGFDPYTKPPMTRAKAALQDLALDSTARFYNALVDGELDGIKPCTVALAQDVFDLYRVFCNRINVKPAPMPRLISALEKKHDMDCSRKRYLDGQTVKGPHGVCYIPKRGDDGKLIPPECPPGETENAWRGACIAAFRNAVKDYKGAAGA